MLHLLLNNIDVRDWELTLHIFAQSVNQLCIRRKYTRGSFVYYTYLNIVFTLTSTLEKRVRPRLFTSAYSRTRVLWLLKYEFCTVPLWFPGHHRNCQPDLLGPLICFLAFSATVLFEDKESITWILFHLLIHNSYPASRCASEDSFCFRRSAVLRSSPFHCLGLVGSF